MTLEQLLASFDWYDNSRLSVIRGCKRKAFYQLLGPLGQPLGAPVGDGANFGTAFHAGTNMYYYLWGKASEPERRVSAVRAFAEEWEKYFPTPDLQSKHRLANGLDIMDSYFDQHLGDDEGYRPIKGELAFARLFRPADGPPFLFLGRIDGIFERLYDGTIWVRELKTTSKSTKDRLEQLKFAHQTLGYIQCLRAGLPQLKITGAIPDVVLVAANKREALRTCYHISIQDGLVWEDQLLETIADWRERVGRWGGGVNYGAAFYQDTERCFDYGKCAFYDLCDYGPDPALLENFQPNTWNPITGGRPCELLLPGDPL